MGGGGRVVQWTRPPTTGVPESVIEKEQVRDWEGGGGGMVQKARPPTAGVPESVIEKEQVRDWDGEGGRDPNSQGARECNREGNR